MLGAPFRSLTSVFIALSNLADNTLELHFSLLAVMVPVFLFLSGVSDCVSMCARVCVLLWDSFPSPNVLTGSSGIQ